MEWIEARLRRDAQPREFYRWLDDSGQQADHAHHFWSEPWWPGGYVIRLRGFDGDLKDCPVVDHSTEWDASEDEVLYGEDWVWAQRFFEAGSFIASRSAPISPTKLIHCHLNARGMGPYQEARWALRFAWNRLTIPLRWRLYLKRRWLKTHPEMDGAA